MNPRVKEKFVSRFIPPEKHPGPAWWFAFRDSRLLVNKEGNAVTLPFTADLSDLGLMPLESHYLGQLGGTACYAAGLADHALPPPGMNFEGLRQIYGLLDENLFWVATRAVQIVEWDRTHRFCGRCGIALRMKTTERAKECPQCGLLLFPRLSPAVIVLVERGRNLLLARSRHFAPGMYSVLAGFVEPGETLEEAVVREVKEEVGVEIKNLAYFGSQPWPFPHSLMIGFTASYAGGEISPDDSEIEDAGWFSADQLPPLPGKISIARKLIDWFLAKQEKTHR